MTRQAAGTGSDVDGWDGTRRWRLVPPAVTPLRGRDLAAGVAGQLRGTGRDRFRETMASFLDAETAGTYTSFRRALCACLRELDGATDGDDRAVLVPAFCSSDYADAIEGAGLSVRRYDVDPATLSADLDDLAERETADALALVAVSPLGYGSPMDDVAAFCEAAGLRLVEAIGYAVGSEYRGRRLGTFGDCAVLNFQQGKPVPVGGGMVVSQDPELDVGDEGRPSAAPNPATVAGYAAFSHPRAYAVYAEVGRPLYDRLGRDDRPSTHPESKADVAYAPPLATMSHFQCTVAARVFRRLDEHRRERARAATEYATELADVAGVEPVRAVPGLARHNYVRYPLLVERPELRADLRRALGRAGIQAPVLYDWPKIAADAFPGAARVQREIVTLPTHPYVTARDRRLAIERVRAVASGAVPAP